MAIKAENLPDEDKLKDIFNKITYTRNDIMKIIYYKTYTDIADNYVIGVEELNQFAGNHWNKVIDFMSKGFDTDMTTYKTNNKSFDIPIFDAVLIMTYTLLIFNHKSTLTKKLAEKDFLSITASELNSFIELFISLLQNECNNHLLPDFKKSDINANIKYVKQQLASQLKNRDTTLHHYEDCKRILNSYHKKVNKIEENSVSKAAEKSDIIYYLKAWYEDAYYEFLLDYCKQDKEQAEYSYGLRKFHNPNAEIYYDNEKEAWIYEIIPEFKDLAIYTYEPEFVLTQKSIDNITKRNLKKPVSEIIKAYFTKLISDFDYIILLQPSKSLNKLALEQDFRYLKERSKQFKQALQYASDTLSREFAKQVKRILTE